MIWVCQCSNTMFALKLKVLLKSLWYKITLVKIISISLLCMCGVVISVNLCKPEKFPSHCTKNTVENVGVSYLINFLHYASQHCKGLDLAMLVCWIVPTYVLEHYVLKLTSCGMTFFCHYSKLLLVGFDWILVTWIAWLRNAVSAILPVRAHRTAEWLIHRSCVLHIYLILNNKLVLPINWAPEKLIFFVFFFQSYVKNLNINLAQYTLEWLLGGTRPFK